MKLNRDDGLPATVDTDAHRALAARDAWIEWRMRDLPAVYVSLMPYTFDGLKLQTAEILIRAQVKADQEHLAQPWRKIGRMPLTTLVDWGNINSVQKFEFTLDSQLQPNHLDKPKHGREDDPDVKAQLAFWDSLPRSKKKITDAERFSCDTTGMSDVDKMGYYLRRQDEKIADEKAEQESGN